MRELGSKMAELKFEAPLAKMDETDDWAGCDFISNQNTINDSLNLNLKDPMIAQENKIRLLEEAVRDAHVSKNGGGYPTAAVGNGTISPNCNTMLSNEMTTALDAAMDSKSLVDATDNFSEAFGGSLEDLVNTFDEKITKCFGNFEENVEALAPVQVRSQDEIMNECQMWWTITGNFGNILPIDWSKSYTRKMHMPTLNLGQNTNNKQGGSSDVQTPADDLNSEDEAIANDLDMHALILHGLNNEPEEPIKSVEEVIKEIEYIIDEAESPTDEATTCESEVMEKAKEVLGAPLYAEKLQYLSINQLNELYMEMEVLIQELSETLINELALRDELEFEKELKNSFISILLAVQNKRRQYHVEKKRGKFQGPEPKYLTTVIPYTMENGTPNNQNLQFLSSVLKAINEDSPTVPTLLTDYILKVLCPT
ncbi:fasciculation and elongation protein zeta-2-like isoform X2 [Musca domestica]|uniref:Fasciculation and elongation protein zeta-2-like isoform X2 n=1 Tax=Musca domestica TaxID=7370 RepID=A0ABM3V3B2_MUSDO|nr:fasciculation and elongation protein zeta-2-like isoform X2 [Musca domestica]